MVSVKSFKFRSLWRNQSIAKIDREALQLERADARELKRMRDELKLAREKARLFNVLNRNRIM